jgi:hypothetical protein
MARSEPILRLFVGTLDRMLLKSTYPVGMKQYSLFTIQELDKGGRDQGQ